MSAMPPTATESVRRNESTRCAKRRPEQMQQTGQGSGRDAICIAPPAQNRTGGFPAYGSHLGCMTARRSLSLATFRMRSSACVTLCRRCVRCVLCWSAFPLVPTLRSTGSSTGRPASFVGFLATMMGSDFSGPASSATAPHLPDADRPSHATLTAGPETSQLPMRSLCT